MALSDNFNRTLLGGNWTNQALGGSVVGIATNAAWCATAATFAGMYWSANSFAAAHHSKIKIIATTTYVGASVRHTGSGASTNFYTYFAHGSLQKFINGVQTVLATGGTVAPAGVVNGTIELDVTGNSTAGNNLLTTKDGVPGTYPSSADFSLNGGAPGIAWYAQGAAADDWVGSGENPFTYYKTVTIDHTQVGGSAATNFPFVLALTDPDLRTIANGGKVGSASGYDIRPYDAARTTPLPYELVSYSPTTGAIELHVLLPSLSATVDTVITLCFGDAGITQNGSAPTTVWDANFVAVYHCGDGTTISLADSTGAHPGINGGGTAAVAGQVGGAWSFSGSSEVHATDDGAFGFTTALTIELWVKPASLAGGIGKILTKPNDAVSDAVYALLWENTADTAEFYASNATGGFGFPGTGSRCTLTDTNWHSIAFTFDGASWYRYLDGVRGSASSIATGLSTSSAALFFGSFEGSTSFFTGREDEIRLSKIARSQAWLIATYNNQRTQTGTGDFYTLGALTSLAGVNGSLSSTLATATASASATVALTATLSAPLATSTLSGTGVVGSVPISASLTQTLATSTLAATATIPITASLSSALATSSLTASATVAVTASLSSSLATSTLTGSGVVGSVPIMASLSATLATATLVSTGTALVSASLARPLATSSLAATGTITAGLPVTGSLNSTLNPLTLLGTAHVAPLPMVCPVTTLADLQTLMAQRWDGVVFWTAEEARLALNEALREWNLLTGRWRTRVVVPTFVGTPELALPGVMTYAMRFLDINGVALTPTSLAELDLGRPSWRLETTSSGGDVPTRPLLWAPVSLTRIAIWPAYGGAVVGIPAAPLRCDGVLTTPILTLSTDIVDLGEEIIDVIADMALHLVAFKEAGARWRATRPYFETFLQAAADENALLKTNQRYRRFAGLDRRRDLQPSTGAANQLQGVATQFSRHDKPAEVEG